MRRQATPIATRECVRHCGNSVSFCWAAAPPAVAACTAVAGWSSRVRQFFRDARSGPACVRARLSIAAASAHASSVSRCGCLFVFWCVCLVVCRLRAHLHFLIYSFPVAT